MSDSDNDEEVEYEHEDFIIGCFKFTLTTVSYMPIHILMNNNTKGVEISGQKLWCGSVSIAQYLLDNISLVNDKIVIELGAGTGLLGMLSNKLGSSMVFLTDNDTRSINHMKEDCLINNINHNVYIEHLDWFNPNISTIIHKSSTISNRSSVLLLAGDVLYKQLLIKPFFETIDQIFNKFLQLNYNISMLLCHVPRAGVDHYHVTESFTEYQFTYQEVEPSEWRKGCCTDLSPPDDYNRAKIYKIQK